MTGERKIHLLTIVSLVSAWLQINIYRKTFINFWIPFSIFFAGGFLLFIVFRKRFAYYRETEHSFLLQSFHGTIMFGGITLLVFMGLNYYVPIGKDHKVEMKVLKMDYLSSRRGCDNPYAIVNYNGIEKQLVFPCNTNLFEGQTIRVKLNKGLFGFLIVEEQTVVLSSDAHKQGREENKQYLKIIEAAEANLAKGDSAKAIMYFERAVRLNPSDPLPKKRLSEISAK